MEEKPTELKPMGPRQSGPAWFRQLLHTNLGITFLVLAALLVMLPGYFYVGAFDAVGELIHSFVAYIDSLFVEEETVRRCHGPF